MATWESYWIAAVAYVVWMVCYVIFREFWNWTRPFIVENGAGMFQAEVGYIDAILSNWVLIGVIGIFISVFAAGLTAQQWGVPR